MREDPVHWGGCRIARRPDLSAFARGASCTGGRGWIPHSPASRASLKPPVPPGPQRRGARAGFARKFRVSRKLWWIMIPRKFRGARMFRGKRRDAPAICPVCPDMSGRIPPGRADAARVCAVREKPRVPWRAGAPGVLAARRGGAWPWTSLTSHARRLSDGLYHSNDGAWVLFDQGIPGRPARRRPLVSGR